MKAGVAAAGASLAASFLGGGAYLLSDSDNLSKHLTKSEREEAKQAAASGQSGLKDKEWDELGFISKYRDVIRREAQKYDLPARFVAVNYYDENIGRHKWQDIADERKSSKGGNASIEAGQMKLNTAMYLDGVVKDLSLKAFEEVDEKTIRDYQRKLSDPEKNISYVARELSRLRGIRQQQVGSRRVLNRNGLIREKDYLSMAMIRTWYIEGTNANKPSARAQRTMEAYDLPWMQELFPEDTIKSCLDTVIVEEKAVEIKENLGKGIRGSIRDLDSVVSKVYSVIEERGWYDTEKDFRDRNVNDTVKEEAWGKGVEYYKSLQLAAIMHLGFFNMQEGDLDSALRNYNAAFALRTQLDDAYNMGVDLPKQVGAGSSVINVADMALVKKRYGEAQQKYRNPR